ncbi:MAG TPA: hypothetical protein VGK06_07335 [Methanosarcina sp.]
MEKMALENPLPCRNLAAVLATMTDHILFVRCPDSRLHQNTA